MDDGSGFTEEDVSVTIKFLFKESDVRAMTGQNESNLRVIRSKSLAGISISEGPSKERLVWVSGSLEEIHEACKLIIERLEPYEDGNERNKIHNCYHVRIIVPASQCGPLIGKGGNKIKEIRDSTHATMVVGPDLLPDSSERTVNISGTIEAICDCIYEVCLILIATPQKFSVVPFEPNTDLIEGPIVFSNGKAYTIQGNMAVPLADVNHLLKNNLASTYFGPSCVIDYSLLNQLVKSNSTMKEGEKKSFHLQEIQVPNDIIDGEIGRGGIKLSEVRRITGARVIVTDADLISSDGMERTITIQGPKESVTLARYLINACVDLQRLNVDPQKEDSFDYEPETALSSIINLCGRPGAMNILANITGFSTIPEFISSFNPNRKKF